MGVATRVRHDHRHEDASVAVEKATDEVQEHSVRDLYGTEGQALPRCESDRLEPAVETDIHHLDAIRAVVPSDPCFATDATLEHFEQIPVRGDLRDRLAVLAETSIGGDQSDCVRKLRRPVLVTRRRSEARPARLPAPVKLRMELVSETTMPRGCASDAGIRGRCQPTRPVLSHVARVDRMGLAADSLRSYGERCLCLGLTPTFEEKDRAPLHRPAEGTCFIEQGQPCLGVEHDAFATVGVCDRADPELLLPRIPPRDPVVDPPSDPVAEARIPTRLGERARWLDPSVRTVATRDRLLPDRTRVVLGTMSPTSVSVQ